MSGRPLLVEVTADRGERESADEGRRRPIVVVLGMHRSGTSLCSHILGVLGVDIADVVNAHPFNARGEWERWELVRLHDRLLDLFDRGYWSPYHDLPLPVGWWADPRVRSIRQAIAAFLRRRMPEDSLFGFKDPRTARLLPAWQAIFDELRLLPKIVLCVRNPAQVARSLADRDGLDPEIGEYRWLCYMAEALAELGDHQLCVVEYEDWFADPELNATKLTRFLGLDRQRPEAPLRDAVATIADAGLRHDAPGAQEARQPLVRALYDAVRQLGREEGARPEVARLVEQFAAAQRLQRPLHREFERVAKLAAALPEREREAAALRSALAESEQEAAERDGEIAGLRADLAAAEGAGAELRGERELLLRERDWLAAESAAWFDAAIVAATERVADGKRRRGWRFGRYVLRLMPLHGRGSALQSAGRARDGRRWARAARGYLDALDHDPQPRAAIWVQFGHALKEAGKPGEAEAAYRRAVALDPDHADALVWLGQLLRRRGADAEAAQTYRRALEFALSAERRGFVYAELAALGPPADG